MDLRSKTVLGKRQDESGHEESDGGESHDSDVKLVTDEHGKGRRKGKQRKGPEKQHSTGGFNFKTNIVNKEVLPPVDDIISAFTKGRGPPAQTKGCRGPTIKSQHFPTKPLYNAIGQNAFVSPIDAMRIQDGYELSTALIDFHNMHSKTPSGETWVALDTGAYLMAANQQVLFTGFEGGTILDYNYVLVVCPMQANQVDCGVYVCIYASELVARGFANLDDGLPALPYGGGLFRRGMRADIVEHALKRLIPTLERSGVMVPHQDPPLSKRVNKPVSPELAEIDAKLRDAVGDIHNISCRVGYCEKDITKLELLVESLTNDLSTTRDELTALSAQVAALPAPPQQGRIGGAGGPSARTDDPATQQILAPTAQLEQQGDSHQIQTAHGVINGLLPGTPGDALTSYRCVARGGALPAPSEDHSGCMGPPPPPSHSVGGVVGSGEYAGVRLLPDGTWQAKIVPEPGSSRTLILGHFQDQQQAARAFAAAAAVLRRSKPPRGRVWQLTGEEMDLLDGCTAEIVRQLTTARVWGRWERWRVELASLGGANPTPASPAVVAAAPTAPAAAPTTLAPANAGIAPPAVALAPAQPTPPGGATAVHVGTTPVPAGVTPAPPAHSTQATLTNPPVQADVVAFASLSLPESDEGDVGNNATTHPTGIDLLQRGV
ncbi:unnamed protein product [Closterium sp. NIES-65]|nr:unnamed protein product [Closterium sp. NIES-65]CAI6003580.1 unnamed protein product [Closterium sp. NIES-65]CAI6007150.1 unnamed protein product [Closterium sp. NIES-65]